MGVDVIPNPMAADQPLFSMLPIPYDTLYFFGIGRQPDTMMSKSEIEMENMSKELEVEEEGPPDEKDIPIKLETVGESESVSGDDDDDENIMVASEKIGEKKSELPQLTSIIREWKPDGSARNYEEIKRSGEQRRHSEYAMKSVMVNTKLGVASGTSDDDDAINAPGKVQVGDFHRQQRRHSDYAQRPSVANKRRRSEFFRSR